MKLTSKIIFTSLLLISTVFLIACQHTASGFGQDMQETGQKIEKSVNS